MKRIGIFLILLVAITLPQVGWSANSVTAETEKAKKAWRLNLTGEFAPKTRRDQEDYSYYSFIGDYFLTDSHRLRVRQDYYQVYSKYSSEHTFQPQNTALFHYYKIPQKWRELSFMWRGNVVLPVSDIAVRDDFITSFTGMIFIDGLKFFNDRFILSVRPFARYNWYKYRTSASGRLLPQWTLGGVLVGVVPVTEKLSAIASASYTIDTLYGSQYDPNFIQKEQGLYSFGLTIDYAFRNNMSTYLSYYQGAANYIVDGRYEVYLYDPLASRYSVGLAATF